MTIGTRGWCEEEMTPRRYHMQDLDQELKGRLHKSHPRWIKTIHNAVAKLKMTRRLWTSEEEGAQDHPNAEVWLTNSKCLKFQDGQEVMEMGKEGATAMMAAMVTPAARCLLNSFVIWDHPRI